MEKKLNKTISQKRRALEKQIYSLQSEIMALAENDNKDLVKCQERIVSLPEFKKLKKLHLFKQKFRIEATVSVECNLSLNPFFHEEDGYCSQGFVKTNVKYPAGYGDLQFFNEDFDDGTVTTEFLNMGPEVKKQFKEMEMVTKSFVKKAEEIAKEHDIKFMDIAADVYNIMCE